MPQVTGIRASEIARQGVLLLDRLALIAIVREHGVCEATGERLDAGNAVAMTVTVAPGVSRLAVVSATYWDSGHGALSSADPDADPDVLDGRLLFPPEGTAARPGVRPRPPEHHARQAPVRQPRPPAPGGTGAVPRP